MSGERLPLRVTVLDTWEEHRLELPATTSIAELKRVALSRSRVRRAPAQYVVKFRGAELFEDGRTLSDAGVTANGALIVLPRRRQPVR